MQIRYIYHSCYEVITSRYQLIFDYFKGELDLVNDKKKIFFASHSHDDHYNPVIHNLADKVVMWDGIPYRDQNTVPLGAGEEASFGDLIIKTSGSTDEGLAFDIDVEGKHIIHAGDLNDWNWPDDTPEEEQEMHEQFLIHLARLRQNPLALFFPVDYRIEQNYAKGVDEAVRQLKPAYLFPMHFTAHPEILPIYKERIAGKVRFVMPEETPFILP
jgi:L-ascorbate metabolism protein UlaG (beta-lactamase superfamily)